MKKLILACLFILVSSLAYSHEMVPTYPKLRTSAYPGIVETEMEMFNYRQDVEYYEIAVFDKDWRPVPFVSQYKIVRLSYLQRVKFKIYIAENHRDSAKYICSKSRLRGEEQPTTVISSMICSKFKD
jgi:hypothetical protein